MGSSDREIAVRQTAEVQTDRHAPVVTGLGRGHLVAVHARRDIAFAAGADQTEKLEIPHVPDCRLLG